MLRIRDEVRTFNRNVDRLARKYGSYDGLPLKVSVEGIESLIYNNNDFRRLVGYKGDEKRRPSMLQRFREGSRPGAQQINPETGNVNWVDREILTNKRSIERKRRKVVEELGLDEIEDTRERAVREDQVNVAEFKGYYSTPEDLADLMKMRSKEQPDSYWGNYTGAWEQYAEDGPDKTDVLIILRMFLEHKPHELRVIHDTGYDEAQIEYIYPEKTSVYKHIPEETRHRNIVVFWKEMHDKYFGMLQYGEENE